MTQKTPRYSIGQRIQIWLGDEWCIGAVRAQVNRGRDGWYYTVRLDSGMKLPGASRESDLRPEDAVSRLGEIVG